MTTIVVSSYLILFAIPICHTSDRQPLILNLAWNLVDPARSRTPIQNPSELLFSYEPKEL